MYAEMNMPTKISRRPVRLGIVIIAVTLSGCGRPPESVAAELISALIGRSYGDLFDPPKSASASGYPSNICGHNDISQFLESSMSYDELSHRCRITNTDFQEKYFIVRTNIGNKDCEKLRTIFHERILGVNAELSFKEKDRKEWKDSIDWLLKSYRVDHLCKNGTFEVVLVKN